MPVLTKVEAKNFKGRLFHISVFAALIIGGTTMIYPFLLMVAGAMRSPMDESQMALIPDFLSEDIMVQRKFLESKYNFDVQKMNEYRQTQDYSFEDAEIPDTVNETWIKDLKRFAEQSDIPRHWHVLGGTASYNKIEQDILREFRERVREAYNDSLAEASEDLGAPLTRWKQLDFQMPAWSSQRYTYTESKVVDIYYELLKESPLAQRAYTNLSSVFLDSIIYPEYGRDDVEDYNEAHTRDIEDYETFSLPRRAPSQSQPQLREEWISFIREYIHPSFIRVDGEDEEYQDFLREKYDNDIERLDQQWERVDVSSFEDIHLPADRDWITSDQARVYLDFLKKVDPDKVYLVGPEFAWADFVQSEYDDIEELNKAYDTDFNEWSEVKMPVDQVAAQYVEANLSDLRWEYALRNFKVVLYEMFLEGRPFLNTMIYVTLILAFALTVQPLAAYALSRFNPPGMWKFIFFFMATMAFPPMVTTIPMFLMVKYLNLLNTFIGLILPTLINGYLLFLLKGFFDSIPDHLYEAAQIEGASEFFMFRKIAVSLSKPILAVVALNTFRQAWMTFMYPIIVAPDEDMHLLAVWLQQFQQSAPTSAVFASIMIASIPTLLVFLFTQKTIMRGIAVPAEK